MGVLSYPEFTLYTLLEVAFALGVWLSAGGRRGVRVAACTLLALGIVDIVAIFFPMHLRTELGGEGRTLTDTMHIVMTGVTVALILLTIGFGAGADGKWFRVYSVATIVVLIVCGVWAAWDAPQMEANLPTPWLGVRERINIYGYMAWVVVLAGVLWPEQESEKLTAKGHHVAAGV